MSNDSITAKTLKAAIEWLTEGAIHVYLRRKTVGDGLVSPGERNDPAFNASHRLYVIKFDENRVPTIYFTLLCEYRTAGKVEVTFDWRSEATGIGRHTDSFPEVWFDIAPERDAVWRQQRRDLTHPAARARKARREARAAARAAQLN